MPNTSEALLFIEELATNDPYRLFSPTAAYVCRFCLYPKKANDHSITCEFLRANQIQQMHEDAEDEVFE